MTAIHFGNQTYQFGQVTQDQVPKGSIVKITYPRDPSSMGGEKFFKVAAVIGGELYGEPINRISGEQEYSRATNFEVIA